MLELGLKGKVAIVTGGSEGLGRATAERFAREGVRVAICARRKDVLEQTAEAIRRATGGEILAQPADVTRPDEVEGFVRAVVGRFGGVDILVNNAGTSAAAGFEKVDDATWQTDFDLKLMAAVRFCRLVIPIMKQRGGGRIVNVTTVGGKAPRPQALPTSVTRAAGITSPSRWPSSTRPTAFSSTPCVSASPRAPSSPGGPRTVTSTPTGGSWASASRLGGWASPRSSPTWWLSSCPSGPATSRAAR